MLVCGLLLGTEARLFDIYTQNLGDIFSQMAVWVLLGTLIAIYSPTRVRAMINILPFCHLFIIGKDIFIFKHFAYADMGGNGNKSVFFAKFPNIFGCFAVKPGKLNSVISELGNGFECSLKIFFNFISY